MYLQSLLSIRWLSRPLASLLPAARRLSLEYLRTPAPHPPPEVTTADPIKVGHEVIWMLQQQINTLTHLNSMLLQQWQQLQQLQPVLQQN